ncbi:MAG TPA: GMC family oxidoreductase [Myxococcales bacterium]|nr:GMC family oxidoreductase [Myxococcales bacterium]
MATEVADACVIGSGAGGGAAAWALARAGLRVLVLERGPRYGRKDFFHDELAVCRRDLFVPDPARDPHMVSRDGGPAQRSADGWIACCVGGGTVQMSGYFFRMRRAELRGWPISYEELEPFYDEVEREIGTSGSGVPGEERRKRLPLPPLIAHPAARLVEDACRRLGVRAFPVPRAIVSADYRGRQACTYCGFCGSYGCEVGAKSSTLATFLAAAERTGRLTLRPGCRVTRVEAQDGRASSVLYLDAQGRPQRARARAVVVACSAIETARLLLASGIANSSGLIGKGLMFVTSASGYGRFPRASPAWPRGAERLPFIDRAVHDLPGAPAGTILFQRPHPNPIFQAERLAWNRSAPPAFGPELKRRMREFFLETQTVEWEAFSEFAPHDGCDVTLDPSVRDGAGEPVARVRIAVEPGSLSASDRIAGWARRILAEAGAQRQGEMDGERVYTVLQCGTARMGRDPRASVVDADCEAHEVKSLFVADSSTFRSSGSAPFTLTILANALRVGAGIARKMSRREL